MNNVKCKECNYPSLLYQDVCIIHMKNFDLDSVCYNCDLCTKTRNFLKETYHLFSLIEYANYNCRVELWKCNLCYKIFTFQMINPGMARDLLHEIERLKHMQMCQNMVRKFSEYELNRIQELYEK